MSTRVFLSYVREDVLVVRQLATALTAVGFDVWVDFSRLLPGDPWHSKITEAIHASDGFVACFSPRYHDKPLSHMNEELIVATEHYRRMRYDTRRWFIPVMLETCAIPSLPIGPAETLDRHIHHVDFSEDWDSAFAALVRQLGSAATAHPGGAPAAGSSGFQPAARTAHVDARKARAIQIGDHNTQIN